MTPREILAYHEAGHAACYRHLGDQICSVELKDGRGLCDGFVGRPDTDTPLRDVLRCLSGPAAEYTLVGSITCGRIDLDDAARYARDAGMCVDDVWPDALALIQRYQDDIEAVAEALLRHGRLDGSAIERLIGRGWISPRWASI